MDLETITRETKLVADQLLNRPDLKRSVLIEGVIHLEIIIDNIIEISDKVDNYNKFLIQDFNYAKKIEILKKCGIINNEKAGKLNKIRDHRNMAAHNISLLLGKNLTGMIKRKKQKEFIIIDDCFIEEYKKTFSECYSYLMIKLLSMYNPYREDLKIE